MAWQKRHLTLLALDRAIVRRVGTRRDLLA
jgi:hypothetical protein